MPKTTNQESKFLFESVWDEETIFVDKKLENGKYWYRFNEEYEWKEMNSEDTIIIKTTSLLGEDVEKEFYQSNNKLFIYQCHETKHIIKVERRYCVKTWKYFYRTNVFNQWYVMISQHKLKIDNDIYEYIDEDKS